MTKVSKYILHIFDFLDWLDYAQTLTTEVLLRCSDRKCLCLAKVSIEYKIGRASVAACSACAPWAPVTSGLQALSIFGISLQRCCKPKRLPLKLLMAVSWSKHENNTFKKKQQETVGVVCERLLYIYMAYMLGCWFKSLACCIYKHICILRCWMGQVLCKSFWRQQKKKKDASRPAFLSVHDPTTTTTETGNALWRVMAF